MVDFGYVMKQFIKVYKHISKQFKGECQFASLVTFIFILLCFAKQKEFNLKI